MAGARYANRSSSSRDAIGEAEDCPKDGMRFMELVSKGPEEVVGRRRKKKKGRKEEERNEIAAAEVV